MSSKRTYAIGDIHGMLREFDAVLDEIRSDVSRRPCSGGHRIVMVGDLIDRGPDSRGVVERCMEIAMGDASHLSSVEFVVLMGNHEETFIKLVTGSESATKERFERWYRDEKGKGGGCHALESYGVRNHHPRMDFRVLSDHVPKSHIDFLGSLPSKYDDGERLFVHAGILPGVPLDEQAEKDMRWIRRPFLDDDSDHGRLIVHGHSPNREPEVRRNRINVDTGGCYGHPLTCAVLEPDQHPAETRFIRIPSTMPDTWID